jgi:hypothetical protein
MTKRYTRFETSAAIGTHDSSWSAGGNIHILDVGGEDINTDSGYIYPQTASLRVTKRKITGPKKITGPIDTPLFPEQAASLLHYGLGSTATTGPASSVYSHVIKKGASLPFFSLEVGRDVKAHKYIGGAVNSFTLDYAPDDTLNGSFDCIFRNELATSALASVTFPDFNSANRAFAGPDVSFRIGAAESSLTASTLCEGASISVENNIAADAYALGSGLLPAQIVGAIGVTGTMDLRYETSTNYDDFIATTEKRINFLANYGSGSGEREIQIDLPRIAYDTNRLPTDNVERFVQALAFTAETDTNGDPIICTVKNSQSNTLFVA